MLNATVRYHLESHVETHQELVERIQRSIYVDDIVSGSTSEEEAYTVYSESKKLLKIAGFNLRKFASNSASLQLKVLQEEASPQTVLGEEETFTQATLGDSQTLQENELKVLGVKWNTSEDQVCVRLHDQGRRECRAHQEEHCQCNRKILRPDGISLTYIS